MAVLEYEREVARLREVLLSKPFVPVRQGGKGFVAEHRYRPNMIVATEGITKRLDLMAGNPTKLLPHKSSYDVTLMFVHSLILRGKKVSDMLPISEEMETDLRHAIMETRNVYKVQHDVWNAKRMPADLGTRIDQELKDHFNGLKALEELSACSRLLVQSLRTEHHIVPLLGGLMVANHRKPDDDDPDAFHGGCKTECRRFTKFNHTEIDLVGYNISTNTIALIELKTRMSGEVSDRLFVRYYKQLWLSWIMFSMTYPELSPFTTGHLCLHCPGSMTTKFGICNKPVIRDRFKRFFPWINDMCSKQLQLLAPAAETVKIPRQKVNPVNPPKIKLKRPTGTLKKTKKIKKAKKTKKTNKKQRHS